MLGRRVLQRAQEPTAPAAPHARLAENLRQPEVGERQRTVAVDQQVGRLDVAVQDAPAVGMAERLGDADEPPRGLQRRVERPAALPGIGDVTVEADAVDLLHREVEQPGGFAEVVDRHDVLMVERRCRARFDAEPAAHRRIGIERRRQHLEGDLALQALLERTVDRAHATAPQQALDPVVADPLRQRHAGTDQRIDEVERLEAAQQVVVLAIVELGLVELGLFEPGLFDLRLAHARHRRPLGSLASQVLGEQPVDHALALGGIGDRITHGNAQLAIRSATPRRDVSTRDRATG